jgi:uncharacterized membrane protein YidH (DUF202 family)
MRDSGLQPQRTALAWSRTALAMVVNSLLVLRIGINTADRSIEFLGFAFLAISGGILLVGEIRRRELAKTPARAGPRVMAACAACVVLVSFASVVAMKQRAQIGVCRGEPVQGRSGDQDHDAPEEGAGPAMPFETGQGSADLLSRGAPHR